MEILLSEAHEQFVRSLVRDGRYSSEDEVIEAALQSLQESGDPTNLEELRREIAIGIEQADHGDLSPFDPAATLAGVRSRNAIDP